MVISGTSWYWGTIWLGKALYLDCSWFTFTFMIIAFTTKAAAKKKRLVKHLSLTKA